MLAVVITIALVIGVIAAILILIDYLSFRKAQ